LDALHGIRYPTASEGPEQLVDRVVISRSRQNKRRHDLLPGRVISFLLSDPNETIQALADRVYQRDPDLVVRKLDQATVWVGIH
jgi:hypothetical protein